MTIQTNERQECMTDEQRPLNVAIMGAGRIARAMAHTLNLMAADDRYRDLVAPYAIASRSSERATKFAADFQLPHAFGSYEEMLADPAIDLVYIATPHSEHMANGIACLQAGKNILVEKAFTANEQQAEQLLDVADDTGLLCTEAIWTRYMPSRLMIDRVVASGQIGSLTSMSADLSYPTSHKARITDPNLAGGALLDVGVYPLNFIDMIMGSQEIRSISTIMVPYATGVDASNSSTLIYDDHTMAVATSSMLATSDRGGFVRGTDGYMVCDNINNVQAIDVYNADHELVTHMDVPPQLTGYEYEVAAAANAIRNGLHECIEMTHADTLRMMALMDRLRKAWKLEFPFEKD